MLWLDSATEAFSRGDELSALEACVDGWRQTRAPEVADLVDAVSARLEPLLPQLQGRLEEFQPHWLAVAQQKRAVDLPRLLRTALHGTERFGVAVVQALTERGALLAKWPADPRSSRPILEMLEDGGYESTSRSTLPFWSSLLEMLVLHGDVRIIEPLSKVRFSKVFRHFSDGQRRIAWFQQHVDDAVVKLRAARVASPELPRAQRLAVARFSSQVKKAKPVASALRAELGRSPGAPPAPKKRAAPPLAETAPVEELLGAAALSLSSGDDEAALSTLLRAWRATAHADIARAVGVVSTRLDALRAPIEGKNRAALQREWLAVAAQKNPADWPRLLSSLTRTLGRSTDAMARLNAVADWPTDPRTAKLVVGLFAAPPFFTSSTRPLWAALAQLAANHGDLTAPPQLEALADRYGRVLVNRYVDMTPTVTWFRNQLRSAASAVRQRLGASAPLNAQATRALQRVASCLDGPDAALLSQIADRPGDVHLRAVLADALQERGDPRGEFIALQLGGKDPDRVEALVRSHGRLWASPLSAVIDLERSTFEHGFLSHVHLRRSSADALEELTGHPIWATVRTMHFAQPGEVPREFVEHSVFKSLERVTAGAKGNKVFSRSSKPR